MSYGLTDEQRLIAETARDFVDKEVVPRARESDRAERFDADLARQLGEMGYLGAPVAEEYGGRGLDYVTYGLIVEEVGRGDSASAPSSPSRPRWSVARSSAGATRSRSSAGCRSCVPASSSAASA